MKKKPELEKPSRKLTQAELKELERLEAVVDKHVSNRQHVAAALATIKAKGFYFLRANSFDEYITVCWPKQLSKQHADRMILEYKTIQAVDGLELQAPLQRGNSRNKCSMETTIGGVVGKDVLPNQGAALELAKLPSESDMADVLKKSLEYTKPGKDGKITISASHVKKAVEAAAIVPPEEPEEEEVFEEVDVDVLVKDVSKEIESFCRTVTKAFDEGLKELGDEASTCVQSDGADDAAKSKLTSALQVVRNHKPAVCPPCEGHGCEHCKELGYVPKVKEAPLKGLAQ